ncbi:MAG: hypothetical protein ACTSPU_02670 [Promethearchaeota archaeon]
MRSKKLMIGLLGIFLAISVVALIPVFMYGFSVNVTEIEASIGLSSSGDLSTSSSLPPSYDLSSFSVEANPRAISAYEYVFSKLDGNVDVVEEENGGTAIVEILITFELTTPSDNSLSFSFSPQGLKGDGLKTVMIIMGPDELNGEVGTFYLTITISIKVTLLNTEILNLELAPVDLTFEIPA